jgi:NDP-sugar pyrophosphorylase family protein
MLLHQIQALVEVGVKHIVLAVNVQPEAMINFLKNAEKEFNIKIEMSQETEPLGTGMHIDIYLLCTCYCMILPININPT